MAEKLDFQVLATSIMGSVADTFNTMCSEKFSKEPTVETIPIDYVDGRMMASAYSKLSVSCFISYINYYSSIADRDKDKPCGVIVLYVKDSGIMKLLPSLGYKREDYTKEDFVKDMVGEFCNNIAGGLKNELSNLGYKSLEMSTPYNYMDSVPKGITIPKKVKECHEVSVYLWDQGPLL